MGLYANSLCKSAFLDFQGDRLGIRRFFPMPPASSSQQLHSSNSSIPLKIKLVTPGRINSTSEFEGDKGTVSWTKSTYTGCALGR